MAPLQSGVDSRRLEGLDERRYGNVAVGGEAGKNHVELAEGVVVGAVLELHADDWS